MPPQYRRQWNAYVSLVDSYLDIAVVIDIVVWAPSVSIRIKKYLKTVWDDKLLPIRSIPSKLFRLEVDISIKLNVYASGPWNPKAIIPAFLPVSSRQD